MGNSNTNFRMPDELANMDLSLINTRYPLSFHSVHGENIRLVYDENQIVVAKRNESFCKGLAFSSRAVAVDEIVCIKFTEVSTSWSGVLRIGLTNQDPEGLRGCLPKYACPDLTSKPGYWAKALSERYCMQDNVLHFYVRENGDMYYGINGVQKGLFLSGIQTVQPLWVILDIYGNSTAVQFLDAAQVPHLRNCLQRNNQVRSATSLIAASNCVDELSNMSHDISPPVQQFSRLAVSLAQDAFTDHITTNSNPVSSTPVVQFTRLPISSTVEPNVNMSSVTLTRSNLVTFHPRLRGRNITLSSGNKMATRHDCEYACAYVFTSRPVNLNETICIKIVNDIKTFEGSLAFGLTTCDPDKLRSLDLPDDSDLLIDRPEYWVVAKNVSPSLTKNDVLHFKITSEGVVLMWRNARPLQTVFHVDQTQKLWMFWDLYGATQCVMLIEEPLPEVASLPALSSINDDSTSLSRRSSQPNLLRVQLPPTSSISLPSHVNLRPTEQQQPHYSVPQQNTAAHRYSAQTHITAAEREEFERDLAAYINRNASPSPPALPPRHQTRTAGNATAGAALQQRSLSSTTSSLPSASTNKTTTVSEQDECSICMSKPINCALYACGHMCMCYDCGMLQLRKYGICPICRERIIDVMRTYKS